MNKYILTNKIHEIYNQNLNQSFNEIVDLKYTQLSYFDEILYKDSFNPFLNVMIIIEEKFKSIILELDVEDNKESSFMIEIIYNKDKTIDVNYFQELNSDKPYIENYSILTDNLLFSDEDIFYNTLNNNYVNLTDSQYLMPFTIFM